MTELHDLTALEQGSAVRKREVSSADLVEHYLERIDRLSDSLGAFVTVTALPVHRHRRGAARWPAYRLRSRT
jgi:amidase